MLKSISSLALTSVLSISCFAAPALALSPTTFVSGKGADTGNCASPASPCRTFQYAFSQTSTGGEIKALDPANYSPITISRSVSITGVEGAGITRLSSGYAIYITAGINDVVNIIGLTLDGFKQTATAGIAAVSVGRVTIKSNVIRNFSTFGIALSSQASGGKTTFLIEDTTVSNNNLGVYLTPGANTATRGVISRTTAEFNDSSGIVINGDSAATVTNSVINNNGSGINVAGTNALVQLVHSIVTGNTNFGIQIAGVALPGQSAGDNFIRGNGCSALICKDVVGTLTNVGTR